MKNPNLSIYRSELDYYDYLLSQPGLYYLLYANDYRYHSKVLSLMDARRLMRRNFFIRIFLRDLYRKKYYIDYVDTFYHEKLLLNLYYFFKAMVIYAIYAIESFIWWGFIHIYLLIFSLKERKNARNRHMLRVLSDDKPRPHYY